MIKHNFSSVILKECDIRGVVGKNLNSIDAYYIGRAFGSILRQKGEIECVIGQDGRLTSEKLKMEVCRGLLQEGVSIINIGLVPTPMVYYAAARYGTGAGLMVTASHNPAEYNGFKLLTSQGAFYGNDILKIAEIAAAGFNKTPPLTGEIVNKDISEEYAAYLRTFLKPQAGKDLKIIWDPGNGAAGAILPEFLKGVPGAHTIICGEVDGNFPNHHPDPSLPSNVKQLSEAVKKSKSDLGIAFDGDGDRLGVVDGRGRLLYGDQLLVLFARDLLKDHPGAEVLSETKASQFFYDEIKNMGGIPVMWKVGHTNQKSKMKERNILLAGETSGHIFFSENRRYDDGLFAAVKLINFLSSSSETLSEIFDSFPRFCDSGEIRILLEKSEGVRIIDEIKDRLKKAKRPFLDIDGIRISIPGGFWSLRSSNTQPHLTIRCETKTQEELRLGMQDLEELLALSGIPKDQFILK